MKKGLLLCSGGMSTTMMAKGLNEIFDGEMKWEAKGMAGSSEYEETIADYAFIFVSPQIRFLFNKVVEVVEDRNLNIPVVQIEPQQYIVTKCPELANIVRSKVKF